MPPVKGRHAKLNARYRITGNPGSVTLKCPSRGGGCHCQAVALQGSYESLRTKQGVRRDALGAYHSFKDNDVRLWLFAPAYNLGNFLRRLALPRFAKHWLLTTLREQLIKIGAKVVRQARYVTFELAKVAVPRALFAAILDRIRRFGMPPPLGQHG